MSAPRRRLATLLCAVVAMAAAAAAAEWYESYQDGVKALAQGQASRAVSLLEQAAGQRPQPGRNVITYGTNVVARYYPYLHLAEAYLQLRDLAGARSALKRSESWGREPAEERKRLAAQVEELSARLAPPASTPVPAPPSPPARETPAAAAAAPTSVPPTAANPPVSVSTLPAGDRAAAPPRALPTPRATQAPPPPRLDASPAAGAIEIVSQPPGASVYVDDALVGTTDPEWGRLVAAAVPPGRHRVRLALAGYGDLIEEVDVAAGGRADFRRRLAPAAPPRTGRVALIGGLAVILVALAVWAVRRRGGATAVATDVPAAATPVSVPAFDPAGPTPLRGTPPGMGSPGVHRDADGFERFGEYRLLQPLGRGGMASVYKAEHRGEVVALKRPLIGFLEEPEFLERFQREAEIGRTLHHPNIVRILERGTVEGVPFLTMELVAGETLQARIQRQGALDARVGTQVVGRSRKRSTTRTSRGSCTAT